MMDLYATLLANGEVVWIIFVVFMIVMSLLGKLANAKKDQPPQQPQRPVRPMQGGAQPRGQFAQQQPRRPTAMQAAPVAAMVPVPGGTPRAADRAYAVGGVSQSENRDDAMVDDTDSAAPLTANFQTDQPDTSPIAGEVLAMLAHPEGVRNAILLSEILNRPEERWASDE